MPRMLNERIYRSQKINRLSVGAERLYYRWLVSTDRCGVAPANPETLRSQLFPLKSKMNMKTLQLWIGEVIKSGLVEPIKSKNGEPLVRFYRFDDFNKVKYGAVFMIDESDSSEGMSPIHGKDESGSSGGESGSSVDEAKSGPPNPKQKRDSQGPEVEVEVNKQSKQKSAESAQSENPSPCPTPVQKPETKPDPRHWDRDVDGVPAERIRLCVRYKLDVEKDAYYRKQISVASLTRAPKYTFLHRLVDSCPESAQIERELNSQVKTTWIWDDPCPHGCRQGRIRTLNERGIPKVRLCECYRQVLA
jgi:hypothetical protein